MPWPPKQRAAIAARMKRDGKSPDEIRRFFHKHGHGGADSLMDAHRKSKRGKR
jgi:hypothetical protein